MENFKIIGGVEGLFLGPMFLQRNNTQQTTEIVEIERTNKIHKAMNDH